MWLMIWYPYWLLGYLVNRKKKISGDVDSLFLISNMYLSESDSLHVKTNNYDFSLINWIDD